MTNFFFYRNLYPFYVLFLCIALVVDAIKEEWEKTSLPFFNVRGKTFFVKINYDANSGFSMENFYGDETVTFTSRFAENSFYHEWVIDFSQMLSVLQMMRPCDFF